MNDDQRKDEERETEARPTNPTVCAALDRLLISRLLGRDDPSKVPEKAIRKLSGELGLSEAFRNDCSELMRAEIEAGHDGHGLLGVWVAFALARARDAGAAEMFQSILEKYDPDTDDVEYCHYVLALDCLLLYGDDVVRRIAAGFPISEDRMQSDARLADDLDLLAPVCRSNDGELRAVVADEMERMLSFDELSGDLVERACRALAAADPQRSVKFLEQCRTRCDDPSDIEDLLGMVEKGMSLNKTVLPPWPELAEEVAEYVVGSVEEGEFDHDEDGKDDVFDYDKDEDDFDKDDEGLDFDEDNERDEAYERIGALVRDFVNRPTPRELEDMEPDEVEDSLNMILGYLWDYEGCMPCDASSADIENLMVDVLPRKISTETKSYRLYAKELRAFYEFLGDAELISGADRIVRTVEMYTDEMLENASDPSCWGMAKSTMMAMDADGVDIGSEEDMDRWMMAYNIRQAALMKMREKHDAADPLKYPSLRIVRPDGKEPEKDKDMNPYDPCPCGSGKKYKFCCRVRSG